MSCNGSKSETGVGCVRAGIIHIIHTEYDFIKCSCRACPDSTVVSLLCCHANSACQDILLPHDATEAGGRYGDIILPDWDLGDICNLLGREVSPAAASCVQNLIYDMEDFVMLWLENTVACHPYKACCRTSMLPSVQS